LPAKKAASSEAAFLFIDLTSINYKHGGISILMMKIKEILAVQ
jgi:hypothetical protein